MVSQIDLDTFQNPMKEGINKIILFAEKLSHKYPDIDFSKDVKNMKSVYQKDLFVTDGNKVYSSITNDDLEYFRKFFQRLIEESFLKRYFKYEQTSRLHQFYNLMISISNIKKSIFQNISETIKNKGKLNYSPIPSELIDNEIYKELVQKNKIALIETEKDLNEILNDFQKNRRLIKTFCTMIQVRVESHHHILLELLKEAKNQSTLPYDIEEICSVQAKISRGKEWETDIKAIRDAISHANIKLQMI